MKKKTHTQNNLKRVILQALKRLTASLPLPTPVLGSVILKEVGEDVSVQCLDDAWVPGNNDVLIMK